jgi:ParB family chromosome partitioning protein
MADVATVEPQYPRLRVVDPRILQPNPHNPRVSPVLATQDEQLIASIKARGIIQPPVVAEKDGALVIRAGHRRSKAAITLSLPTILVLETEPGTIDLMDALAENLIRASMNPVDIWRAVENLEAQGWNQEALASALALTVRTVRKLKLLAKIHPPMLDVIAKGNMPAEEQLRTIANARVEDQVQVWKALRPKKGHDVAWWEIARALSKPRIPFSAAQFDDQLAEEFGVVWEEDLFEQAGEENRYTTNAEGFFGAQQAWMSAHLPPNGTVLTLNESGTANLPKGAERVSGKPAKGDKIGYYVDPRSAEIRSITYRLPKPTKPAKAGNGGRPSDASEDSALIKTRPDVTQKGAAMIGDIRTEALHQALARTEIPNETLIGLLVLAFAATNVSVETGQPYGRDDRRATADRISEGGVLTADPVLLTAAARDMLKVVLSCRANMTDSGFSSRVAGETLGATTLLPTMATEDFLSCLSRHALERSAAAEGVKVAARVKDTRAAMVRHFAGATWRFPGAAFAVTPAELAEHVARSQFWDTDDEEETGETEERSDPDSPGPEADLVPDDGEPDEPAYPIAAE